MNIEESNIQATSIEESYILIDQRNNITELESNFSQSQEYFETTNKKPLKRKYQEVEQVAKEVLSKIIF